MTNLDYFTKVQEQATNLRESLDIELNRRALIYKKAEITNVVVNILNEILDRYSELKGKLNVNRYKTLLLFQENISNNSKNAVQLLRETDLYLDRLLHVINLKTLENSKDNIKVLNYGLDTPEKIVDSLYRHREEISVYLVKCENNILNLSDSNNRMKEQLDMYIDNIQNDYKALKPLLNGKTSGITSFSNLEKIVNNLDTDKTVEVFKQIFSCNIDSNNNTIPNLKVDRYGKVCKKCKNCEAFSHSCIACRTLIKTNNDLCLDTFDSDCRLKSCVDCTFRSNCKDVSGSDRHYPGYENSNTVYVDKLRLSEVKTLGQILNN